MNSPEQFLNHASSPGGRLKIFHINMHNQWGGQPNRVLTECRELRALGHEAWVAGPRGCVLCARAREAGLPTFDDLELRRGLHPGSFLRDYRALKALFARERFDIVHAHGSQDAWLATLAALATRPRPALVRSRHNTFPVAGHPFNRWLYGKMDWVVTIAPQVNPLVCEPTGFPPERVTAIYSVPDSTRFCPRDGDPKLRAELGIPEGAPVIGMIGRLAPEKGYHLYLRAAARAMKEFPDARFLCVGRGRSQGDIERLVAELGIAKSVILTGFRTDVPDVVALFDVFCLTPVSGESLGTSILEAFCMEKPAIATEVGGTGESVRDGQTGFLIKPAPEEEQIAGIAEAMRALLRDPELRRRLGRAGRELALSVFGIENLARRTEAVYRQAIVFKRERGA
jgi:glycosyltransferase involved in cell wall biosynthesis